MNNAHTVGSKYAETQGLDVSQIAKLIRRDIKAAVKAGELPERLTASVRISRFSMGQSINVVVTCLGVQIVSDEWARFQIQHPHRFCEISRYTEDAEQVIRAVSAIVNAYNFDNSDSQVDYFCVRFYAHVNFDRDFERVCREAAIDINREELERAGKECA